MKTLFSILVFLFSIVILPYSTLLAAEPDTTLCRLTIMHWNGKGEKVKGELVVNKAIANDVTAVFKELFDMKYPIERMQPIDAYGNDDERSMRANNTSGYCYRVVKNAKKKVLSKHGRGMAIDINPLYNPCFSVDRTGKRPYIPGTLQPATAEKYVNRKKVHPYTVTPEVVAVFKKHGFKWGGDWRTVKDYQHFEK